MARTARVVITLDYDINNFTEPDIGSNEESFIQQQIEDYVYEDLSDLMRGDRLGTWAEITITKGGK
jgi:hypothetical protein